MPGLAGLIFLGWWTTEVANHTEGESQFFVFMKVAEKKKLIKKLIEKGDKRSYNEIAADLELQIWNAKFDPMGAKQRRVKK